MEANIYPAVRCVPQKGCLMIDAGCLEAGGVVQLASPIDRRQFVNKRSATEPLEAGGRVLRRRA